jgi:hypothetical protein
MWISRCKEFHAIFLGGALALETPISEKSFIEAAKSAWQQLRFELPELVASAQYEGDGKAYMRCKIPDDDDEASLWAAQTILVDHEERDLGFEYLRKKVLLAKTGALESEPAILLFHPKVRAHGELVLSLEFLLNVDHQVTDGIGIRILLGRYLALLAASLAKHDDLPDLKVNWQESSKHLSPAWSNIMNQEQLTSGPEYERVVESNRDVMFNKLVTTSFLRHRQSVLCKNLQKQGVMRVLILDYCSNWFIELFCPMQCGILRAYKTRV